MPENINTTPLDALSDQLGSDSDRQTMVEVDHVSMVFNMASEQLNSLKEYAIALARRELMFKEFRALDDVSFVVKKGDVFGILGTNGSGKSTMLKIVAGVLEPSEGACTINGNIAPLIELGAGFDMELTARENIYLNGALLGYSRKFINQHFDEIVDFAEIEAFLDMPMKNYSSGMVARIAFAIATAIVPEILIVDEVLSVGDFMFQQKCERRIMQLIKEYGVTVLIVSHNNDQIERLCNKAIWIEKGHTRIIGSSHEVCRVYSVLGGRPGSHESEELVLDVLNDNIEIPKDSVRTISGEDRYGTAIKLLEEVEYPKGLSETVILAPGEVDSLCLIANALAGMLDVPLLLTKRDALSDVTAQELKRLQPDTVISLGAKEQISSSIFDSINSACKKAVKIVCVGEHDSAESARSVFLEGQQRGAWGSTAVVTHDGCTWDVISLLPFICSADAPLFFNTSDGVLSKETIDAILSGPFNRLIVVGGQTPLPDTCLQPIVEAGLEIVRFCGDNAYHANELINAWIQDDAKDSGATKESLVISSIRDPSDAFAVGPFVKKTRSSILFEDPQNLDSIAHAIDFIEGKRGGIKHLTFLGDNMRFNKLDKEILGKAVARGLAKRTSHHKQ